MAKTVNMQINCRLTLMERTVFDHHAYTKQLSRGELVRQLILDYLSKMPAQCVKPLCPNMAISGEMLCANCKEVTVNAMR